ncbi:two-component sensor histidine kinase [Parvularcula flava]|uniref:histidine kinase n=1 Tax=Aquisalinus luteolus TaxID=1566827 RepID=A0A8J3EP43_9PROT|nr:ATP-binding protein [Aquisalinus luteolus]NHK27066.1 two-component sensor histidine kinase [Aquisalinus luteolus]GGH94262.1 two-component sensor histidine kinase [Aquisalinus luteolus]
MSLLRRIAPKSLFARTLLIVALPLFVTQSVVTYIFFNRHWEEVTGNLSANVAGNIALVTELYLQAEDDAAREEVLRLSREDLDMAVRFQELGVIPESDKVSLFSVLDSTLERQLEGSLRHPFWYNTAGYWAYVEVRVQLDDGYLVFLPLRERVFVTNGQFFILWLIATTMLLGYVTIVFMRNQVRSITRLAAAAEAFGLGRDMPEFKPSGAREVRAAGNAFIAMRQRIKRHLNQRTTMLAGVSHDLRTPLTRLKLALAMQPETDDVRDMKNDVDEMETMLEGYLSFARNQNAEEPVLFDLTELVNEVVDDNARTGKRLQTDLQKGLQIDARRNSMKRAISNLVSNAFKHGRTVCLTTRREGANIEIIIDDDGPGIDPAEYAEAFKPFSRLDNARNQNTPGIGLGLTVVRDVARGHGGDIVLDKSPQGGLRAMLRIPG